MPHPRLATETGIASDKEALDSPGKWREQALWKGPPEAPSGSHRVPGILTPDSSPHGPPPELSQGRERTHQAEGRLSPRNVEVALKGPRRLRERLRSGAMSGDRTVAWAPSPPGPQEASAPRCICTPPPAAHLVFPPHPQSPGFNVPTRVTLDVNERLPRSLCQGCVGCARETPSLSKDG